MTAQLVILSGLPGSGKTAIASMLTQGSDYMILSRDAIKRVLFADLDAGIPQNYVAFTAMQNALPILLAEGRRVVLDGMPFNRVGQAETMESLAEESGAASIVLFFDCPPEVAASRLAQPDPTAPHDRTPDLVHKVVANYRPIPEHWIRIDASQGLEEVLRQVKSVLNEF